MKFNTLTRKQGVIKNHEGATAYRMTPQTELYTAVVTAGLSPTFYEKESKRLARIRALIGKCDPEFVAKLAVYTRTEMYLRSVPLVLVVELARQTAGSSLVSKAVNGVVQRADEITELLAYYQLSNGRTDTKKLNRLSKQIQKGLKMAFNKFDEYQFAKYNRAGQVTLKDALFLVHPKAKDEAQQALFNKIVADALETPYTWETELSALGTMGFADEQEKQTAFTQKWEELIESKKLGYMALMRNLRNIMKSKVSAEHIKLVCDRLSDERAIARAKQLPFRFLAAYREVKKMDTWYVNDVLNALEKAAMHSASNISGFGRNTKVVIACDVSGSMQMPVSRKSKVLLYDVGLMLGMLLQSQCRKVISGMFGNRWKVIQLPQQSILANVDEYYRREGEVGYATNGYKVIVDLIRRQEVVDKVMLFTDTQMWDSSHSNNSFERSWSQYKRLAPNAKLYLFDLAGYGQMPLRIQRNDVHLIAGWSNKVFDILAALDGMGSAIEQIMAMEL